VGWGGEAEDKCKTCGLGQKWFNRTTKEEAKITTVMLIKNIQSKGYTVQFFHCPMPSALLGSESPPLVSSPSYVQSMVS